MEAPYFAPNLFKDPMPMAEARLAQINEFYRRHGVKVVPNNNAKADPKNTTPPRTTKPE